VRYVIRTLLYLVVLSVVVGGLAWSFWPQPVLVEVTPITTGPLRVTVDEDGKTRIQERYIVSTPISGRLSRITLDPGDAVEVGTTLLATIEPQEPELLDPRALAQAQAKVKAARAALDRLGPTVERARTEQAHADKQLARAKELLTTSAISREYLEATETAARARAQDCRAAEFAQDVAKFELELAEAALWRASPDDSASTKPSQFHITAPITGQVLRVFQESTTVVPAGTQLLELGDPTHLEVEVDVLSSDAVKIRPGTAAYLEQWGGDRPLRAVVRRVEPAAFTKISALGVEEQRVNVILDLDEPLENRRSLGDGFRVEARIVIWEADRVLQLPTGALFRHANDWAVFVVRDGVADLRTVQIGHRNSLAAEIQAGLQEGEQVILHPSDQVTDGVTVQVREIGEQ